MSLLDGLPVVPEPSKEYLNERQLTDYRSQREQCLTWLLTDVVENPFKALTERYDRLSNAY